jgi:hypothetical protein
MRRSKSGHRCLRREAVGRNVKHANAYGVIELDPEIFVAYNNRGIAFQPKKDYERAIAKLWEGAKRRLQTSDALSQLGLMTLLAQASSDPARVAQAIEGFQRHSGG